MVVRDPASTVRQKAAAGLGLLGDRSAVALLEAACREKHEGVRLDVREDERDLVRLPIALIFRYSLRSLRVRLVEAALAARRPTGGRTLSN